MNLADMLGYADIGQLKQIAGAYGCECDGHSKHGLMQSILQAVGRRELFDERVATMPPEDLRFLQSLLFDERNAFSLEELIARVKMSRFESVEARSGGFKPAAGRGGDGPEPDAMPAGIAGSPAARAASARADIPAVSGASPKAGGKTGKTQKSGTARKRPAGPSAAEAPPEAGPRETIVRFKASGWLFNGISGNGRYLFQVPDDLKLRFREALHRKLAAEIVPAGEPRAYRDEHALLEADLARLLRFASAGDVPLNREGVLYRRQLVQLLELFAVGEDPPGKNAWRFGYGRRFKDYPDRLALLYDYAYSRRWLAEEPERLMLTEAGKERLENGLDGEPLGLYRFWLRLYRRAVPNLPAMIHWIGVLAPGWVTARSLEQALLPLVKPFYYDAPETVLRLRVLEMLIRFGMLSAGEHDELGPVLRVTKRGRELAEASSSAGLD